MKFITIDASKSINANSGEAWYRAEVKVSVDDNEVPEEVFKSLKDRLDGWLPNPFETVINKPQQLSPEDQSIETMIAAINSAKSLKTLEWVKPRGENEKNEKLTEAYQAKIKQLQP